MPADILVLARTARRRYAVRRSDLLGIQLVPGEGAIAVADPNERPCVRAELGPLLDPNDHSALSRRRALIVPLRRRLVALLVDDVDSFQERAGVLPLPELLRARLLRPWTAGVVLLDDEIVLLLDIRAVAMTISG